MWLGMYDYNFDRFASLDNLTVASRGGETWTLDRGHVINGANVEASITTWVAGGRDQIFSKEFWHARVASNVKPTRVEFFENREQAEAGTPFCFLDASTDALYLKDYDGFENYIPRGAQAPFDRLQGRVMFFKIIYNGPSQVFRIDDVLIKYKLIR
jgi:hypothetical protein